MGVVRRSASEFAVLALWAGSAAPGYAETAPFTCSGVVAGIYLRAEGLAERTGDVGLICTGGTPTPAGQPVPQFNVTVLLNTNVTTKLVAGNQFTESLLLADEPVSEINPTKPLLNCGNTGAPDNGNPGAGVCSIISTGNPAFTYDGTPNGFGNATCDGGAGRPAPNTYGCGRPNAFQGRLGTAESPGQVNAVTFFNVPFDPPGQTTRFFRITNLRANAVPVADGDIFTFSTINAVVTATGPIPVTIQQPEQVVAIVVPGLFPCQPSEGSRICISEGFQDAWRSKNISFLTGDHAGIAGNGISNSNNSAGLFGFGGTTNYPADVAQNSPGPDYGTESMFEWQNNAANAPPSPNPPRVVGPTPVTATQSPLNSAGFSGLNTGINLDGAANAGTRIAVKFLNIPNGASVQIPSPLYLFVRGTSPYNGDPTQLQTGATGVMVLTTTDPAGAGAFGPASGTLTAANPMAVYEILWADPDNAEFTEIPYSLQNAPQGTNLQSSVSFAPFYSDSASAQASATAPVPRFQNGVCTSTNCISVFPDQGPSTGPVKVTFTGSANLNDAQVKLSGANEPDIAGTSTSSPTASSLVATFDLTGAATGARDVVFTPVSGPTITIAGAFGIGGSSCAFSVSPQAPSFPVGGGVANLVVTPFDPSFGQQVPPASRCAFSAATGADWITLLPVSPSLPLAQPYSVAPSHDAASRSGSISVGGQPVFVTQDGTGTCTFAIAPQSEIFGVGGGSGAINVTAPPGCPWVALSFLPWVSITGGGGGSGNGVATIQASANSGGLRSGTVLVAGQTFSVSQSAPACGATDVSDQVAVTEGPVLPGFGGGSTEQIKLTNNGPSVPGPVSVVFDSLCLAGQTCFTPQNPGVEFTACQTTDGGGRPRVPVAPTGLAAGQTLTFTLKFLFGRPIPGANGPTRVFSGTPSQ